MAKQQYLERYMLIIKKVRKGLCTLKEIEDYLDRESELRETDLRISSRTFQRDLNEIRSLYDIDIQYDFSKKGYFIEEDTANVANLRMIEAFDIFNVMKMSEHLAEYIHFEERRPQGTDHFYELLQAIKEKQEIHLFYQKFWQDHVSERTLQPYALKEAKSRWYLIAYDEYDSRLKTYGLDRIKSVTRTKKKFSPNPQLNINEKFKYAFGILAEDDSEPEIVELSFSPEQGKYITTNPLHWSQEVVLENEEELRIKLQIHITYDFVMELLSFGATMKVLAPVQLQERLKESYKSTLSLY